MSDIAFRKGALEAILMVANEPVSVPGLAFAISASEAETDALLRDLAREYAESEPPRGFQLREVAGGWRFYSHPRYADIVTGFVTAGQSGKLSVQALETLAVIAYRQPVTRAQIAAIRGVEVESVLRTLTTRGMIQAVGTTAATGAILYGTTDLFLEKMGMNSIEELAPLAPYLPDDDELDEVEREIV
ncbi:MAG: SMC-Scp complex subunit ScpB [Actinomycetaceae bacterium]|nr:SMC-Scp complex subunit ScpB [Actinomycetaceae bacterium]